MVLLDTKNVIQNLANILNDILNLRCTFLSHIEDSQKSGTTVSSDDYAESLNADLSDRGISFHELVSYVLGIFFTVCMIDQKLLAIGFADFFFYGVYDGVEGFFSAPDLGGNKE